MDETFTSLATKLQRERITETDFRDHLINVLLIAATLGIIIVSCAMATIALELNLIRSHQTLAIDDLKTGLFGRLDSSLWKADTFLTTFSEINKNLARGLTEVRIQVKQSTDEQQKSTAAISKATTATVTKALQATNEVVQAIVEKPAPLVEVKSPNPTITVPAPNTTVRVLPPEPPPQKSEDEPAITPKRRRWYWPFSKF